MVHTRGQSRFSIGDRVLCYEPDTTKAQVLYQAKVLDVVEQKDQLGKRRIECLIHFQGWNSSWDRLVNEDHVLEDTEDNRNLQKMLAEKYLPPSVSERRRHATHDTTDTASDGLREDGLTSLSVTAESSVYPAGISLSVPDSLRHWLDADFHIINKQHKVVCLPADTPAVDILEQYVRHWQRERRGSSAATCMAPATPSIPTASQNGRGCGRVSRGDPWLEAAGASVPLCREVADGLRVVFDAVLEPRLLYNAAERDQCRRLRTAESHGNGYRRRHGSARSDRTDCSGGGDSCTRGAVTRRSQRLSFHPAGSPDHATSSSAHPTPSGYVIHPAGDVSATTALAADAPTNVDDDKPRLSSVESDASGRCSPLQHEYTLLPSIERERNPADPSTVYGAIHLLRMFVVLPDLLSQMQLPERRLKLVLHHCTQLLDFMARRSGQLLDRSTYR